MAIAKDRVTVYSKGAAGNIVRQEVHFRRVLDHGTNGADVVYQKPRGRAEYVVSSFYSSFWAVVDGWGHPAPDSLFTDPVESSPGVTVARGRYRSCDPAWVSDFFKGAGAHLPVRAMFHNRVLHTRDASGALVPAPSGEHHTTGAVPRYSEKCYACDAPAVGVRDRRPEGLDLESACARHADPTIASYPACMYCTEAVDHDAIMIDREFAHRGCHADACRG